MAFRGEVVLEWVPHAEEHLKFEATTVCSRQLEGAIDQRPVMGRDCESIPALEEDLEDLQEVRVDLRAVCCPLGRRFPVRPLAKTDDAANRQEGLNIFLRPPQVALHRHADMRVQGKRATVYVQRAVREPGALHVHPEEAIGRLHALEDPLHVRPVSVLIDYHPALCWLDR